LVNHGVVTSGSRTEIFEIRGSGTYFSGIWFPECKGHVTSALVNILGPSFLPGLCLTCYVVFAEEAQPKNKRVRRGINGPPAEQQTALPAEVVRRRQPLQVDVTPTRSSSWTTGEEPEVRSSGRRKRGGREPPPHTSSGGGRVAHVARPGPQAAGAPLHRATPRGGTRGRTPGPAPAASRRRGVSWGWVATHPWARAGRTARYAT